MANKKPAEQWYSGDWFRAVDVRKCSWAVRGIWREMLDIMCNEQEVGKIKGTKQEICRVIGCTNIELERFFAANKAHNFSDVTECNGNVTIINRRMYRAYLKQQQGLERVRRYRKRKSNAEVTPYSSSSSSLKEKEYIEKEFSEQVFCLTILLLKCIHRRKQDFKKPNLQNWAIHIDRMLRLDKRNPANIEKVIRWCQQNDFWQNNILSTKKLRQHFDRLELQMRSDPKNPEAIAERKNEERKRVEAQQRAAKQKEWEQFKKENMNFVIQAEEQKLINFYKKGEPKIKRLIDELRPEIKEKSKV